jgi:hypothetical protein
MLEILTKSHPYIEPFLIPSLGRKLMEAVVLMFVVVI